jgi:Flp pilus assembly protein TadB
MARQKQLAKEAKTKRATDRASIANMSATERRAALRRGDPGVLPRRDQGKTKALARDWVDSHRMMSNYLLFLFVVMIAGAFMPVLSIVTIALFAALLVEWYLVGRKIRKLAIERFDKAEGTNLSIGFYAGSRAYLPRRWRLPAPRVERGEEI